MKLTYIQQSGSPPVGDGGDQYTGLDRFGRVVDQRWLKESSGVDLERVQYGYDAGNNRVWRDNLVADGLSANQDEYYTYDGRYQLLTLQRGTLNGGRTGISGTPTWAEDLIFDPTGNWENYVNQVNGATTLNQNRTHNAGNEIVTISGSSSLMTQNAAGNMVKTPQPLDWDAAYDLTYDAWNRLVAVLDGTASVAVYAYDGQNRRVSKSASGSTRDYYYTSSWQIIEERLGTDTIPDRQFIWGLMSLDNLILRDKGAERLYALGDYYSCTAIIDAMGTIQERYGYNAFGEPRFMDTSFNNRPLSAFDWETLYDSYRWDVETGFFQVRYRYLHPALGRWITRDPIGYRGGINLYAYVGNKAQNAIDPSGLETFDIWVSAFIPDKTFTFPYDSYLFATWHGDNRTTAMVNGSSRAWNHFKIETDPSKKAEVFNISGAGTTTVDYGFYFTNSAADTAPPVANITRSTDNKITTVTVLCETKDPLIVIQTLTPALHYSYTWVFNTTDGTLCITGSRKQYPGYDMVINGTNTLLFLPPPKIFPIKAY